MRHIALLLLLLIVATGCASASATGPRADTISFDRGAFSLGYADFTAALRIRCEKNPLTEACVKFGVLDAQVRQAIIDAPKVAAAQAAAQGSGGQDFSQIFSLLMSLAPLLAGS
jgi:hypothetical protein